MIRTAALTSAAYAALTVVMSWPYVSYSNFASASYGGDARLIIWTLAWDNHAVLSGLPLFQSNLFFPAVDSLRYNEHLFGVSLFTLPWAAAGASPVLAYSITWWLAWLLNGVATFVFLRRYVRDVRAAFVGSLAFVCSFYVMSHAHGHLHLIWMWPLPLSALLLERWFDAPAWRRLALWAVVFVLGALTSWYVAVMMLMVNGIAGLIYALSGDRSRSAWTQRLIHLTAAAIVVAAVLYPFARHYVGLRGAPGEAAANSATVASYLVPPQNTLVGQWWLANVDARPGPIWGEQTLFAGWLALGLALVGFVALLVERRDSQRAWIFPVLIVVGFLVSLGPSPGLLGGSTWAPFAWLSGLPGFEGMRAPARFGAVMMLGVSGLGAIGASTLMRRGVLARPWAVLVLVPLMLSEWFVVGFPAGKPAPHAVPPIYQSAEVREAKSLVSLPEYSGTPDWVQGGDYLYYSMAHWRPIVNGFGRTEPAGYAELVAKVRDFPGNAQALRLLGLQYVVVHAERYPNHGREILAAARASAGCRLVRQVGDDYLFELIAG
ncbi:MAG: hypothetical protein ABL986_10390 [Vicinamibacterales bacterium]